MNLNETDIDEGYFQPVKRNVDQTVGFFLMVLIVFLFFSIFLAAILSVQSNSRQSNGEVSRGDLQHSAEIGDMNAPDVAPKRAQPDSNP